jgi:hypothetical protein
MSLAFEATKNATVQVSNQLVTAACKGPFFSIFVREHFSASVRLKTSSLHKICI